MINTRHYTKIMSRKLQEGKSGKFSLERKVIPKGTILRTYTPAGSFYYDKFNNSFPIMRLIGEDGTIWMSDTPMEQEALRLPTILAYGNTLILGLGIGLLPTLIRMWNKRVTHITIVEREPDIVHLVYNKIKWSKTEVIISEGEKYLKYCKVVDKKFDFIYIDVWKGIIAPIREIDKWLELAKPCLTEDGEVRCWLQELYDRIEDKLPKEPVQKTGFPGIYPPCLICGKKLRYDYAGLCLDCADSMGVSELFIKEDK